MSEDEIKQVEEMLSEKLAAVTLSLIGFFTSNGWKKPEPLLSPEEAAKLLNVKEQTLALWRSKSMGPSFCKIEKSVKYKREDLETYIKDQSIRH